MTANEAIGKRLNELCAERKITVSRLCTFAGATQSTVNDIINGVTKNPGVVTIKKLCDALEMTLSEFFDTEYFNKLEQEVK